MGRRKIYTSEWDVKLKELYESGMSLYEIQKLYGISAQTTKDRLLAQGVKIRDADEARENRRKNGKKS